MESLTRPAGCHFGKIHPLVHGHLTFSRTQPTIGLKSLTAAQ